jgi:hypothetical protein
LPTPPSPPDWRAPSPGIDLIKEPATLRLVDTSLAADARRFEPLSAAKTAAAIDAIVDRYDPAALRRTRASARGREVVITEADDTTGTAALYGSLLATDAAVLDRKLTHMARQVCDHDPRTIAQRRADALGTLAAGGDQLACRRRTADCPAALETHPARPPWSSTSSRRPPPCTPSPIPTPTVSLHHARSHPRQRCATRSRPIPNHRRSGYPRPTSPVAPPYPPRCWPTSSLRAPRPLR